jgi:hypothetical protein
MLLKSGTRLKFPCEFLLLSKCEKTTLFSDPTPVLAELICFC